MYSDGSSYCFGCRDFVRGFPPYDQLSKSSNGLQISGKDFNGSGIGLAILPNASEHDSEETSSLDSKRPKDLTRDYPEYVLKDLSRFNVTVEELIRYDYFYSASTSRLWELVYESKNLVFLTGKLYTQPSMCQPHSAHGKHRVSGVTPGHALHRFQAAEDLGQPQLGYSSVGILSRYDTDTGVDTGDSVRNLAPIYRLGNSNRSPGFHKHPKYLAYGEKDRIKETKIGAEYAERGIVVLTEDSISSLVVSRVGVSCWPLYGVHLSHVRAQALSKQFHTCYVWLDRDKFRESVEIATKLKWLGVSARSIFSDLDPKYYSNEQIKDFLGVK